VKDEQVRLTGAQCELASITSMDLEPETSGIEVSQGLEIANAQRHRTDCRFGRDLVELRCDCHEEV
jgi:hypothetical protein